MKAKITRTLIRKPNLHGVRYACRRLSAEVIRCDFGRWATFCQYDDCIISLGQSTPDVSQSEAIAQAKRFVTDGILPNGVVFFSSDYTLNSSPCWVRTV